MTAQADPYVRVYYRIVEDDKFATVYPDDAALATWLRLLIIADGAFPAAAALPRRVSDEALSTLVGAGLVDLVGPDHFRIHGLESERTRRSEVGRKAAAMRWQSGSNADALREQPTASAPALVVHPTPDADPLHSAPIRATPIQSEPNLSPRRGNDGLSKIDGTKKKPHDEERIDFLLGRWIATVTTPATRRTIKDQLADLGIFDPDAELARRAA